MLGTEFIVPDPEVLRRRANAHGDKIAYRDNRCAVTMENSCAEPVTSPATCRTRSG